MSNQSNEDNQEINPFDALLGEGPAALASAASRDDNADDEPESAVDPYDSLVDGDPIDAEIDAACDALQRLERAESELQFLESSMPTWPIIFPPADPWLYLRDAEAHAKMMRDAAAAARALSASAESDAANASKRAKLLAWWPVGRAERRRLAAAMTDAASRARRAAAIFLHDNSEAVLSEWAPGYRAWQRSFRQAEIELHAARVHAVPYEKLMAQLRQMTRDAG